ncbi:mevalonate kinase [Staphylococcus edaphicus]|uniref:mevalonate kinase n=1 Tax=Staphylococcus edaphicus TaxID=1955013 RepID=A0A2C6WQT5_9STAP|nr:mevalonate kinase [Staphylococcus edaphicus]PHK50493.1 mevalonate kinase [Staphylococcus edaphicus]UQW81179.1 mevalonate kinase [Staphylococcus edaphicus]
MAQQGYGEANGKVILIGEHAVTFGEPAIAIPFTTGKVKAKIESLETTSASYIKSDVYDGTLQHAPEHLKAVITRFIEKYNIAPPIKVSIDTNLPPSRGLGSSAAMAVAFVRASFDYLDKPLTDEMLIEEANWAERIAHGKPSGIDTQTIVSNKPVWFKQGHVTTLKPLDLNGYMVVIDTGVRGSTKQAVEDVHHLCEVDRDYLQYVEHIGKLVHEASDSIEHHNFEQLAKVFNLCQENLRTLTVSHDKIEEILDASKEQGAIAGKLTGGGRGGSMIVLASNIETAKRIVDSATKLGAHHTWIEYLGG